MQEVQNLTALAIAPASSGNNTVIAGVAGQVIRVYGIDIAGATATAVTLSDGTTTFLGSQSTVNVLTRDPLAIGRPRWVCGSGNGFIVNLGAANAMTGMIYYDQR